MVSSLLRTYRTAKRLQILKSCVFLLWILSQMYFLKYRPIILNSYLCRLITWCHFFYQDKFYVKTSGSNQKELLINNARISFISFIYYKRKFEIKFNIYFFVITAVKFCDLFKPDFHYYFFFIYCKQELKTNKKLSWINRSKVNKPDETHLDLSWSKGQLIGEFRLGSTIVMLLEGPKGLKFNVGCDQRVRVGKAISPNVNLNTNLSWWCLEYFIIWLFVFVNVKYVVFVIFF